MTQLFSVEQAARLLAISPWTVRDLVRKGTLSPVRVGRRLLLDEETSTNSWRRPGKVLLGWRTKVGWQMKPIDNDMNATLRELAKSGFYGAIEIKLEAGRVVLIRITENHKPQMERPRHAENERS